MRKLFHTLLFSPAILAWGLFPVALPWVLWMLVLSPGEGPLQIASYVVSAYALTIFVARWVIVLRKHPLHLPSWIVRRRPSPTLLLGLSSLWNLAYGLLQLYLGLSTPSRWCQSLAVYYLLLALLRFLPAWESRQATPRVARLRLCAWILLGMNLCLPFMVRVMILEDQTFLRHEIVAISLAAFSFFSLTRALLSLRPGNALDRCVRVLDLVAALVSILSLESTLLTTFGDGTMDLSTRTLFLGLSGVTICLVVVLSSLRLLRIARQE